MGETERARLRAAALHLDRYRAAIEAEVDRRLGRSEPTPHARREIVRRFRSFCRLASVDPRVARPSLDGLGGTHPAGLEQAISRAVEVACECGPSPEIAETLLALGERFRAGIRQLMQPAADRHAGRGRRRQAPGKRRRVRAAIDRIGDAYLALCLDTGKVFDVNPAAETLFASEPGHLLERPLLELVAPTDRERFAALEARLDAGEDSGPVDLWFLRDSGEAVRVQLTVVQHTIGARRLAILTAREPSGPAAATRPGSAAPEECGPTALRLPGSRRPLRETRA
ncbi:MAG: PAS domain-containing protein [Myxococcota bacterium]